MHPRDLRFFNTLAETLEGISKSNLTYLIEVAAGHHKDLAIILFPYKPSDTQDSLLTKAYFESPFINEFISAIHTVYAVSPSKRFGELAQLHDKFCNVIEVELQKLAVWSTIEKLFNEYGKQNSLFDVSFTKAIPVKHLLDAITKAISAKVCQSFQVDKAEFSELSALFKIEYDLSREGGLPSYKEGFDYGLSQSTKLALASSTTNIPLVKSSTTDQLTIANTEVTPRSLPSSPRDTRFTRTKSVTFNLMFINIPQEAKAPTEEIASPKEPKSPRSLIGRIFGKKN